jgi:hypothetical protein
LQITRCSLHVTDDDGIHTLELHEDAPNLEDGHRSETPKEDPNTETKIFPKRGPLFRDKEDTMGWLYETYGNL